MAETTTHEYALQMPDGRLFEHPFNGLTPFGDDEALESMRPTAPAGASILRRTVTRTDWEVLEITPSTSESGR